MFRFLTAALFFLAAPAAAQIITVEQSPVYMNEAFTATGSGFEPGEKVKIYVYDNVNLEDPLPEPDDVVEVTADENGNFEKTIPPRGPSGIFNVGLTTNPDEGWESFVVKPVVKRPKPKK